MSAKKSDEPPASVDEPTHTLDLEGNVIPIEKAPPTEPPRPPGEPAEVTEKES